MSYLKFYFFAVILCLIASCSSSNSTSDADKQTDSIISNQNISSVEVDVNESLHVDEIVQQNVPFPENTIDMGAVAFVQSKTMGRVYLSRADYVKLSDDERNDLKPLGLVIKLNSTYYILNRQKSNKDTDWYSAMKNASKCHPYDDGRWNLPTLYEARCIAKVQDDIIYWIPRWERDWPRVLFEYNGEDIETFVSDNSSSVFIDVLISNGQIEVNRVQKCDEDRAKRNPYTQAYYISKIEYEGGEMHTNSNSSVSSNNNKQTPVQVWKQCMNCFGSGQCPYCYGQGVYSDAYGTHDCPVCTDGRCNMCAGHGGHYEIEYR